MGRRSRLFGGDDDTALWRAAEKHDDPRVRELLLKDPTTPQLNRHHPAKGTTPLMIACKKKRRSTADVTKCAQVVQHLLEFGANLDVVDQTDHKNTALHYAAYANATLAVEYLLHAGANAFALNQQGHTPLDLARLRGRKQATAILTQHLSVKSGWLDMNVSSLLPMWKRRWCVALACDLERTRFELCIFHAPSDLLPDQVLHINSSSRAEPVSGSSSTLYSWMEKPYMFTLDQPLVRQGISGRRFSRDPVTGLTHGHGAVQVKKVLFAAESEATRHAWMVQLGNGSQLSSPSSLISSAQSSVTAHGIINNQGRRSLFVQPRHPQSYEPHVGLLSAPTVRSPFAYGSDPGFSSFSPSPRQHLASPTTVVSAYTPPPPMVTRTPPPSAPTFIGEDSDFYQAPGSYISTLETSSATSSARGSISISSMSLENIAPNAQLPPASTAQAHPSSSSPPSVVKSLSGGSECAVCMDSIRDAICVPCGHIAGCYSCLSRIKLQSGSAACCPICRSQVQTVVKIYDC